MERHPFFSIIVPAHNEEGYIEETLKCLAALEYPKESYEVIVVENGSTDETLSRAHEFIGRQENKNVSVLSVPAAGVSAARNTGAAAARKDADWIIYLDADTHIKPSFLRDVLDFLAQKADNNYVVGSASLWPWPYSHIMAFWYAWSNLGMYIRKSTYAGLLIVKRELLEKGVQFDETVHVAEDIRFAAEARKKGKSFFIWTKKAHTSTRRFTNGGWKKIPVWVGMWLFAMIVPIHVQRRFKYKVVR